MRKCRWYLMIFFWSKRIKSSHAVFRRSSIELKNNKMFVMKKRRIKNKSVYIWNSSIFLCSNPENHLKCELRVISAWTLALINWKRIRFRYAIYFELYSFIRVLCFPKNFIKKTNNNREIDTASNERNKSLYIWWEQQHGVAAWAFSSIKRLFSVHCVSFLLLSLLRSSSPPVAWAKMAINFNDFFRSLPLLLHFIFNKKKY